MPGWLLPYALLQFRQPGIGQLLQHRLGRLPDLAQAGAPGVAGALLGVGGDGGHSQAVVGLDIKAGSLTECLSSGNLRVPRLRYTVRGGVGTK